MNQNLSALEKWYKRVKENTKSPTAVLWFNVDNCYEIFGQDAIDCAKVLGTTLRYTDSGLAHTGFDITHLDEYLPKMVHSGRKVGIVTQQEESNP